MVHCDCTKNQRESIILFEAVGYAIGGTIADLSIWTTDHCDSVGDSQCNESWRVIFLSEVVFVLPLCVVLYCLKQPENILVIKAAKEELEEFQRISDIGKQRPSHSVANSERSSAVHLRDDPAGTKMMRLLKNRTFVLTCLGYAFLTFVIGTFAVEGIAYLQNVYVWSAQKAGVVFGIQLFVAGISGSVFGGLVLDKMKSTFPEGTPAFMYCGSALRLLICLDLIAFPCALVVVLLAPSLPVFIVGGFVAEFCIFGSFGPVNNAILWSVLLRDRPLAVAMSQLTMHCLGDALAPVIIGNIVDLSTDNGHEKAYSYSVAFAVATLWLLFSAIAFTASVCTIKWLNQWMIGHRAAGRRSLLINDPQH